MAADVVLRQVQRRLAQRQHRHLLAAARHHHARLVGVALEHGVAGSVAGGLRDGLAAAVQQRQLDTLERLAAGQRGGKDVGLRGVPAQVQADLGDVEIGHLEIPAEAAGRVHHGDVDAGLTQLADLLHRQEADVAAVRAGVGGEAAQVDALGAGAQLLVKLPARDRALQAAAAPLAVAVVVDLAVLVDARAGAITPAGHLFQEERQRLAFNAQELHVHLGGVDRDHRQPAVQPGRQHHAAAGKVEGLGHGLALRGAGLRGGQRGTTGRLQRRAQIDPEQAARRHIGQHQHPRVVAQHPAWFYGFRGLLAIEGFALGLGFGAARFVSLGRRGVAFEGLGQALPILRAGQRLREAHCDGRRTVEQAGAAVDQGKGAGTADVNGAGQRRRLQTLPDQQTGASNGDQGGSKRELQARRHGAAVSG